MGSVSSVFLATLRNGRYPLQHFAYEKNGGLNLILSGQPMVEAELLSAPPSRTGGPDLWVLLPSLSNITHCLGGIFDSVRRVELHRFFFFLSFFLVCVCVTESSLEYIRMLSSRARLYLFLSTPQKEKPRSLSTVLHTLNRWLWRA